MGIWHVCLTAGVLTVGQAPQPLPVAPSAITVPVEAGKSVKVNVAAPPYANRPKEWPLLRIGSAKYEHAAEQPATVTLEGSIQTAEKVDYRITVTLQAEGGKEVAASSTVEHVQHVELGRVMTVLRTWKLDFGKLGEFDRVKALRIRVLELGARNARGDARPRRGAQGS